MNFIVTEGLDASGKSTQIEKLKNYLADKKIAFQYLHFPRTNAPYFGELIARFLRGEFGEIDRVDPYLVALIYAADREHARDQITSWQAQNQLVIVDRYVYSNIAFQCAKIADLEQKKALRKWILELEFGYYHLPQPDLSLFLDAPFSFTLNRLKETREGDDRDYLKGKDDIHEKNLDFQAQVRDEYIYMIQKLPKFVRIDCSIGDNHTMDHPDEIFNKILKCLKSNGLV